jgi:hypothetical protein
MAIFILALTLMAGCSATAPNYDSRPFFLPEQSVAQHGRKTWFDHLVEFDPGQARTTVAPDYQDNPPERVAVLPFVDHQNAQYRVNKVALTHRNEWQREEWAWTYANRLRRSIVGQLAEREFTLIPLPEVDTALQDHGINTWRKLTAVPPQELGQWLGADTVVYGEVLQYDAYYALLVSLWEVGVRVRLVSTRDGHQLFESSDDRYAVNVQPAFDPVDFGVNSALSLLELRDITLARAEDEVAREIARRVPMSDKALTDLQQAARKNESIEAREAPWQPVEFAAGSSQLDMTSLGPRLAPQIADPPAILMRSTDSE